MRVVRLSAVSPLLQGASETVTAAKLRRIQLQADRVNVGFVFCFYGNEKMNTDIRLSIDFWTHPKTVKLERRVGLEAVKSLQILWIWAAKNRPSGDLSGMDSEDVEIAAQWSGAEGQFFDEALKIGWLEKAGNRLLLHDWKIHNPWAANSEGRGDKARLSRLATVNRAEYERLVRAGRKSISKEEYSAIVDGEDEEEEDLPEPEPEEQTFDFEQLHKEHFGAILLTKAQSDVLKRWQAEGKAFSLIQSAYEKTAGAKGNGASRWSWIMDIVEGRAKEKPALFGNNSQPAKSSMGLAVLDEMERRTDHENSDLDNDGSHSRNQKALPSTASRSPARGTNSEVNGRMGGVIDAEFETADSRRR